MTEALRTTGRTGSDTEVLSNTQYRDEMKRRMTLYSLRGLARRDMDSAPALAVDKARDNVDTAASITVFEENPSQ